MRALKIKTLKTVGGMMIPGGWRLIKALIRLSVLETLAVTLLVATAAVLVTVYSLRIAGHFDQAEDTPQVSPPAVVATVIALDTENSPADVEPVTAVAEDQAYPEGKSFSVVPGAHTQLRLKGLPGDPD